MKIAFFSDIHANLPALEAVLADIDRQRPDFVYCLGDLVGYHVWPNEVTELIRRRGIPTLTGNYDEGVGLGSDDCGCAYKTDAEKQWGAASIAYTNASVTASTRAYLRALPRHMRLEFEVKDGPMQLLMAHGSPRKVNEYLFEDRPADGLLRMMEAANADILLVGHTHKPYHRMLTAADAPRCRHLINLGSVGKPKDGDPRACYVLLEWDDLSLHDPATLRVRFERVAYDVEQAAQALEASPLPAVYAEMLRKAY
jgi:diadenosine tetraphosphatase ApaH/serine/threonine PP2A family protein phosphatase